MLLPTCQRPTPEWFCTFAFARQLANAKNSLRSAIPFYEQPGGIRVRVLQDTRDPDAFIEIVEYEGWEKFREDERRVESDTTMGAYLQKWRTLLLEPPVVEVYGELSL